MFFRRSNSWLFSIILLVGCDQQQSSPAGSQFIKSGKEECEQSHIPGEYLVIWRSGKVTVESAPDEADFAKNFLDVHRDEIIKAEPHYQVQVEPMVFEQGWGGGLNWGVYSVQADWAWGKALPLRDVVVAVIDSGLDMTHPELQGQIAINQGEEINGIDDDGNGYVDDRYGYDFVRDHHEVIDETGHGTHVSGVISARHDRGKVLGLAPGVKVLPLRFIARNGGGRVIDAVNAIRYAAEQKAQVINASWGGESCSLLLRDEIAALEHKNILFVAAAGNQGNDLSRYPEYPAAFTLDNLITVGASTFDEKTARFSNYGQRVSLVAPGANIASTFPLELDMDGLPDGVATLNGTSMAAPFVSAAAAWLWGQKPDATYQEVKRAILLGVEPGPYPVQSQGQLNLLRSLDYLN
jgi:subtilisin family serine protease